MYNKVVSNEKLFRQRSDYLDFLSRYKKYFGNYFKTYAYALMPNHFHFLIKVEWGILDRCQIENT